MQCSGIDLDRRRETYSGNGEHTIFIGRALPQRLQLIALADLHRKGRILPCLHLNGVLTGNYNALIFLQHDIDHHCLRPAALRRVIRSDPHAPCQQKHAA